MKKEKTNIELSKIKALRSDLCPLISDKQILAEVRGDGTYLYSAIVVMKFKCFFGLMFYKKKFFVHKVEFSQIYYLVNSKEWHYQFDDIALAEKKLDESIIDWQKEYLRSKTVKKFLISLPIPRL